MRVVAVSDIAGMIYNGDGLDVEALICHKRGGGAVASFPGGEAKARDTLIGVTCDIWIPAARPDVLHEENVAQLQAKLVLQGANIPATEAAERWMHAHGILSVPDFIANAGGVICAVVEYHGGSQDQALATIEEKIRANTVEVLARARKDDLLPRQAALQMAVSRIVEAKHYRR
jgi:glutamate dehydrogenase/leucine dehydrogenase